MPAGFKGWKGCLLLPPQGLMLLPAAGRRKAFILGCCWVLTSPLSSASRRLERNAKHHLHWAHFHITGDQWCHSQGCPPMGQLRPVILPPTWKEPCVWGMSQEQVWGPHTLIFLTHGGRQEPLGLDLLLYHRSPQGNVLCVLQFFLPLLRPDSVHSLHKPPPHPIPAQ